MVARATIEKPHSSVDELVDFAEKYFSTKDGRPFTIKDREWVRDQFWRAVEGFKLWPVDKEQLCSECAERAGSIVDYAPTNPTISKRHLETKNCAGLSYNPVIITLLKLKRRRGKTVNGFGFACAYMAKRRRRSITYLAGAEDQSEQLCEENLKRPIRANAKLRRNFKMAGSIVECIATKSFLEVVPTTHKSTTGRGRSIIIIDEARDVPARTALAIIPAIFAENGMECPAGHTEPQPLEQAAAQAAHIGRKKCKTCGQLMTPWWGRVVIMSSAGLRDGSDQDWFEEGVDHANEHPDPNVHVFDATIGDDAANPSVSRIAERVVGEFFGALPSTEDFAEVEVKGKSRGRGDDNFASAILMKQCMSEELGQVMGGKRPAIAFLDTSTSADLTNLGILEDASPPGTEAWSRVALTRVDIWDPEKLPGGVIDERQIVEHLDAWLPEWPGLVRLWVDVRALAWANKMVKRLQVSPRAWAKKVMPFKGGETERDTGWDALDHRIRSGTISLPADPLILKERDGVRVVITPQGRRKVRDINRRKSHAEVLETTAALCYLAHELVLTHRALLSKTERAGVSDSLKRSLRPVVRNYGPENSF